MMFYPMMMGFIPAMEMNKKPPTLYSIMESIVNYNKEEKTKIKNLSKEARGYIFDFDYPLTNKIEKEKFECMILNKFLMRRIGFDTLTAFKIQLDVTLNSIMPMYNKMFDSFIDWNLFLDGETIERITKTESEKNGESTTENKTVTEAENHSTTFSENISDRRNSITPENHLEDVRNGEYVNEYNYDTTTVNSEDNSDSSGTSESKGNSKSKDIDESKQEEKIIRTPADKISIYKELQNNINNIYNMIFKDLDNLFYQID